MFRKKRHNEHRTNRGQNAHIERGSHIQTESGLLKHLIRWLFQAKGTLLIFIAIIVVYFYSLNLPKEVFESLIFTRESFFQLNFFPMVAGWFLHANLAHLIGNLIALMVFGRIVERRFGTFRFFLIFFCAAIASDMVASVIFGEIGIGASGAIYGLMATSMLVNPFYITFSLLVPLPVVIVGWLYAATDLLGIITPRLGDNTGHIAHLAGFFVISLLVYLFARKDVRIRKGLAINIITVIILALLYFFYPDIALKFLAKV